MGNETEMSKYVNKILKNKAKKDIGTLKKNNGDYTIPRYLKNWQPNTILHTQGRRQQYTQMYQLQKKS